MEALHAMEEEVRTAPARGPRPVSHAFLCRTRHHRRIRPHRGSAVRHQDHLLAGDGAARHGCVTEETVSGQPLLLPSPSPHLGSFSLLACLLALSFVSAWTPPRSPLRSGPAGACAGAPAGRGPVLRVQLGRDVRVPAGGAAGLPPSAREGGDDHGDARVGAVQVRRGGLGRARLHPALCREAADLCRQPHQRRALHLQPLDHRPHRAAPDLDREGDLPRHDRRRTALRHGAPGVLDGHWPASRLPHGPVPPPRLAPQARARAPRGRPPHRRQRPHRTWWGCRTRAEKTVGPLVPRGSAARPSSSSWSSSLSSSSLFSR